MPSDIKDPPSIETPGTALSGSAPLPDAGAASMLSPAARLNATTVGLSMSRQPAVESRVAAVLAEPDVVGRCCTTPRWVAADARGNAHSVFIPERASWSRVFLSIEARRDARPVGA